MSELPKIMVIDDEEDLCQLVKENLEGTGKFTVVTLTNPLNAEQVCRQEKPNLILMDVVMPERSGIEVGKALRQDPETASIPLVIMSGLGELVYRQKEKSWKWLPNRPIVFKRGEVVHERIPRLAAAAYGADGYIAKPFLTSELVEAIEDILGKARE